MFTKYKNVNWSLNLLLKMSLIEHIYLLIKFDKYIMKEYTSLSLMNKKTVKKNGTVADNLLTSMATVVVYVFCLENVVVLIILSKFRFNVERLSKLRD